jgi:hypothetical protein
VANVIRIKRSTGSSAPVSLANAELAFSEGNAVLHYGTGTGGAGGSATSIIKIGGAGAFTTLDTAQTISGNKTFTGTVDFSAATIASLSTTGNVTVGGDLTVNGTTTTINSTVVTVDDKLIELGSTASPTDAGADGGGVVLKGTTDKSITWVDATDCWTFNQSVELGAGLAFRIDGTQVLSKTALGSGVTGSSLTSVGTITSGTWNGTTIAIANGGTGATDAATARTNLGVAIGSDVQAYDADLTTLSGMQTGAAAALALLTATEVGVIDGSTSATATTLVATDRMVINDAGTMVQVALSDLVTFLEDGTVSGFDIDGGTF